MKYYDINTKGFYEETGNNRIEITGNHWQELLEKQSLGGIIKAIDSSVYCLMPHEQVQDGCLIDISERDEYKALIAAEENTAKKAEIQAQIDELDLKSIRALREGGIKDEITSQTWLEYYTEKIQELRQQITEL